MLLDKFFFFIICFTSSISK